ncbi:MAG: GDSL-type esterase/lipase family protein [Gammaproteobacteria bacterium]
MPRNAPRGWHGLRAGVVSLYLVALLTGCAGDTVSLPPLADDAVLLAFGDSLTRGTGAPRGAGYPEVLASLIGREVVNAGVPGELSAGGRARLARVLDRVAPALLILCHGGNDLLRRHSTAAAHDNLVAMIALARERAVPVLLLGVPAPGLLLATADLYHEVARATATPLEDGAVAEVLGKAAWKADPVHPNAAGYRVIAERVRDALVAHGAL